MSGCNLLTNEILGSTWKFKEPESHRAFINRTNLLLAIGIGGGMDPAFTAVTRREYVPVGSAPASMLVTVTTANTEFMPSEIALQQ